MATPRPELAAYFRQRAVERIAELDALRARRERGGAPGAEADAAIRSTAHQLAGTAASFGFPAIGELARTLEHVDEDRFDAAFVALARALDAVASRERGDAE